MKAKEKEEKIKEKDVPVMTPTQDKKAEELDKIYDNPLDPFKIR